MNKDEKKEKVVVTYRPNCVVSIGESGPYGPDDLITSEQHPLRRLQELRRGGLLEVVSGDEAEAIAQAEAERVAPDVNPEPAMTPQVAVPDPAAEPTEKAKEKAKP